MSFTIETGGETTEVRELSERELDSVVGAGQSGGPICPVCHSTNVVFNRHEAKVISCNACGYHA